MERDHEHRRAERCCTNDRACALEYLQWGHCFRPFIVRFLRGISEKGLLGVSRMSTSANVSEMLLRDPALSSCTRKRNATIDLPYMLLTPS